MDGCVVVRSVLSSPICRICHGSATVEQLLLPCECRGAMVHVHRSCIERWLNASNSDSCEICRFPYRIDTVHRQRSFREVCV